LTIPNTSIERLLPLSSTPLLYLIPVSYVSERVQNPREDLSGAGLVQIPMRQKGVTGGGSGQRATLG
jgi:hypothetical protein